MTVKIPIKYPIGSAVILVTDPEELPRIVTEIRLLPGYIPLYALSCGTTVSEHYEFEIDENTSTSRPITITFSAQ